MTAIHITGWKSTTIMPRWKLVNLSHKICFTKKKKCAKQTSIIFSFKTVFVEFMPFYTKGRTDSSGLRLYYRPVQPGQLDVGILTTGLVPLHHLSYNIPPRAPQFHTYGVCNTSLFSQVSPGQRPELLFFSFSSLSFHPWL